MFSLRIVNADHGDCSILEFGDNNDPRYILIDGGPKTVYPTRLKPELDDIRTGGGQLDCIVVSHVDDDHICGILELFDDLRQQHINRLPPTIKVASLWHNTFSSTIEHDNYLEPTLRSLLHSGGGTPYTYAITNMACYSINQGHMLTRIFEAHNIPINPESKGTTVSVEDMPKAIRRKNLTIHVVGPTDESLKKLRKEWLAWLKTQREGKKSRNPFFKAMAEGSFTNLSSIMLLAKSEGKKFLLTGDGRGDHLIQGLRKAKQLNRNDELHVDILKLPHHGSERNVSRAFFDKIQASTYIVSANGRDGNPDLSTLTWIVESAKQRREKITILATNKTPSTRKLATRYPPTKFQYNLSFLNPRATSASIS